MKNLHPIALKPPQKKAVLELFPRKTIARDLTIALVNGPVTPKRLPKKLKDCNLKYYADLANSTLKPAGYEIHFIKQIVRDKDKNFPVSLWGLFRGGKA